MSRSQYIPQIVQKYPNEDPNDVFAMMQILAQARATVQGVPISDTHYSFAGKILCVIFDPVKTQEFSRSMASLRRAYRGIASDETAQSTFRGSLREDILSADNASQAIRAGSEALFYLPATFEED